ncbi:DNA-3-methyladenine glycosylase 2 family protein [Proteiniclasticum sp. SCR006]|uniref:DNA-3-methyladenine glycosylase II n=1 Tax=Proteiniclasticum aestuarii TaxID=2817862 RepID=A0A939H9E4_9CLOT|nr:DNA-3-methyladenine glycosylase 2 family protein [Proteiniclasticum aestuarii]MBO1264115.1 DNA-3-methyladenine glycosylase 2 family protein [Proteiniclasticum aestuarii]
MATLTFTPEEYEGLKKKDRLLGKAMEKLPLYEREVDENLFRSLMNNIVGQQISMKAAETVWKRFLAHFGEITPEKIHAASLEEIQALGISMRKATYIRKTTEKIHEHIVDLEALWQMADQEVADTLVTLNGIGPWTAEMIMIFSMGRKDIMSYGDLAIRRGLMLLYGHEEITKELFRDYQKKFSPYGTLASLYLWEISTGKYDLSDL